MRLVDAEDDSTIGYQMEGAGVVNLTDEVQRQGQSSSPISVCGDPSR